MANATQVILQQKVEHLGECGDLVKVRAGYARNFLIPRQLALPATRGNLARVDSLRKAATAQAAKELTDARVQAKKLEGISVKLARSVGEENRMYGSVTSKDIAEAYAEAGSPFDRKKLELPEPIKRLGLTEVLVRLHPEVSATLRVEVIKKS